MAPCISSACQVSTDNVIERDEYSSTEAVTSFRMKIATRIQADSKARLDKGMAILRRRWNKPAPSTRAASSISPETCSRLAPVARTA